MSRTYKATGINLKGMALGESDRLLTILTREFGLIRAVAPGARKPYSTLGGRSGLFVVNELLIAKGRSLDKITQAETLESYPGLSQDLGKLAASQYLAELVLCQALSEQPQEELFSVFNEHLKRLERLPNTTGVASASLVLAHLSHGIFHLLALAGIAPQVQACCLTQHPVKPDFIDPNWQVGFSVAAGGIVSLAELSRLEEKSNRQTRLSPQLSSRQRQDGSVRHGIRKAVVAEIADTSYQTDITDQAPIRLNRSLSAVELALLQNLAQPNLPTAGSFELEVLNDELNKDSTENFQFSPILTTQNLGQAKDHCPYVTQNSPIAAWVSVEQILRQYVQYHFGRSIRSAAFMDACLLSQLNSP